MSCDNVLQLLINRHLNNFYYNNDLSNFFFLNNKELNLFNIVVLLISMNQFNNKCNADYYISWDFVHYFCDRIVNAVMTYKPVIIRSKSVFRLIIIS